MKIGALSLALIGALTLGSAARAEIQGDANHGKQLFLKDGCYQCHGYAGQGAAMTGPRISDTKLPFDAFLSQLRQPANQMAPYEKAVLSDSDAADIYAYVRQMPAPPDPKTIPLLAGGGK